MKIRAQLAAFAVAAIVVVVLSGCYSGAPVGQVPQSSAFKPKPSTQQGYQQTPGPITVPNPTPAPEPTPVPEPAPVPEPEPTPEPETPPQV